MPQLLFLIIINNSDGAITRLNAASLSPAAQTRSANLGSSSGFCFASHFYQTTDIQSGDTVARQECVRFAHTKLLAVPSTCWKFNEMIVILAKVFSSILLKKIIGDYLFLIALVEMMGTAQRWLRAWSLVSDLCGFLCWLHHIRGPLWTSGSFSTKQNKSYLLHRAVGKPHDHDNKDLSTMCKHRRCDHQCAY